MLPRRQRKRHWEAGLRRVHAEAAGVMRLMLLTASEVDDLTAAAGAGDAFAVTLLKALDVYRRQIDSDNSSDAPLCLTCDRQLRDAAPLLIALVIPARDDASACMAIGVCEKCQSGFVDRAAAERVVMEILRERVWPDLRPIAPPSAPGRA